MSEEQKEEKPAGKTFSEEEVRTLRDQLQGYKAELENFKNEYKGFSKDEFFALKSANEELQKRLATSSPDDLEAWQKQKEKEISERFASKLEELEGITSQLSRENKTLKVYDKAVSLASEDFTSSGIELLRIKAESELDLVDGEIVAVGKDGKPVVSSKDPRNLMGLNEWIEQKKTDHPDLLKNKRVSGGMNSAGARSTGQVVSSEDQQAARAARLARLAAHEQALSRRN